MTRRRGATPPAHEVIDYSGKQSLLKYVTQDANLTEIAHHAGYPDSAHFSRSIRQVFGLQPKEVMAGSRRLAMHGASESVSAWRTPK